MHGMALVPETRALFATMPVEDNLLLGAWRPLRPGGDATAPSRWSGSSRCSRA